MALDKKLIGNLILFFVSLLLCFIVAELVARAYFVEISPLPKDIKNDGIFSPLFFDGLIYTHDFYGCSKLTNICYQTNELGIRGEPLQSGVHRRILFLGDSATFGLNLPENETFAEKTEQILNEKGYAVESINSGIPGHGTLSEYYWLKDHFNLIQPDIVVLGFTNGDITNNVVHKRFTERSPFINWGARAFFHSKIATAVFHMLYVPNTDLEEEKEKFQRGGEGTYLDDKESKEWNLTYEYLDAIDSYTEEHDAIFIVLNLPNALIIGDDSVGTILDEYCEKRGIRYVDMNDFYIQHAAENGINDYYEYFFPEMQDQGHSGPLGTDVIAAALTIEIEPLLATSI